jgi:acyl-CoA synthetase (AMP-forming)/AMP-acid ligase II
VRKSRKMILTETLLKANKFFPEKRAIVCGRERWTYREFYKRVNRLSHCLKNWGVRKEDKVAVLHPNCHTFLEAYYGVAQMGAISVPSTFVSPLERLPSSSRIQSRRIDRRSYVSG